MKSWLKYKTRGHSSPKDKPKVFFCCHPSDFSLFFDSISKQVLDILDCAVWYALPEDNLSDWPLEEELPQMQLVIFPVTTRFLFQESFASNTVIPAALEYHIPILPLIQEPNLAETFNEKYGNIQFLDTTQNDPTAIRYERKLDHFLHSVLTSTELQEKIRQAFHLYIFLSYRKIDRAYAQELMRLIHKAPVNRDVAIWYDEFLVPGENFDDAIKQAIDKSDLFAMVITPNSVEPENYVMKQEYPYAKQRGKPILAAEFVPTNHIRLNRYYKQLGRCFSPADENSFLLELETLLKRAKSADSGDTPEHQFLIGLAYLGGIDVEVNRQYALSLITSAAERGLPEASQKLSDMYRLADGVPRDYEKAASWQECAAQQWETLMHKTGDWEIADRYLDTLHHLADTWNQLWQFEKGLDVCRKMIQNAKVWKRLTQKTQFCRYQMQGCLMACGICRNMGNIDEALRFCEEGRALNQENVGTLGVAAYGDTVVVYEQMGCLHQIRQDYEQAINFYRSALELRMTYFAPLDFLEAQNNNGIWLDNEKIGELYLLLNRPEEATPYLHEALTCADDIVEAKQPGARAKQSIGYDNLAWLYSALKQYPTAIEYAEKAIQTALDEWTETGALNAGWNLSVKYSRMGDILRGQGNPESAKFWYEKSLALKKELLEINDTDQLYDGIAGLYAQLFLLEPQRTDLLEEAYKIWALLSKMNPEVTQYQERRDWLQPAYEALCAEIMIKGEKL